MLVEIVPLAGPDNSVKSGQLLRARRSRVADPTPDSPVILIGLDLVGHTEIAGHGTCSFLSVNQIRLPNSRPVRLRPQSRKGRLDLLSPAAARRSLCVRPATHRPRP